MESAKRLIEKSIKEQEKMTLSNLGESEMYAVNYCILVLKDLFNEFDSYYEGEDGKLYKKDW